MSKVTQYIVRKVPHPFPEYGAWVCIGELEDYYLANEIDCEGTRHHLVYSFSKAHWKLKTVKEGKND